MFEPLKNFFSKEKNCPATVLKFFDNRAADSQLHLTNSYVLKTEKSKIPAFAVAAEVQELRNLMESRKQAAFIPIDAAPLFEALSASEKSKAKASVDKFYSVVTAYLEKWSNSLDGNEVFGWMNLTSVPDWENDVKPSLNYMIEHHGNDSINGDSVFDELNLLQQVVTDLLSTWTSQNISSEMRWIEVFKNLKQQRRPITQISLLVEYAFAIPGSSTDVERLFSIINDVWEDDKGQMSAETLEAHLNVIFNSNLDCLEFHKSIKNNKRLLSQVHSTEKYQASTSTAAPHEPESEPELISDNSDVETE